MAYSAFISYSHTADGPLAAALQSALHRFAKPWYKLRALHIFRDQTNLAVNPALWSSIREALDQSQFFIVLASPEAAASPWVAQEAEYWVRKNGTSHILMILTGGTLKWDHAAAAFSPEYTDALPKVLLDAFPEEPLFLDLRWARDRGVRLRLREPRFHEAILQLASTLHNRPKDELDGADIRMQRQNRLLAASGLLVILLIALFALRQTRLGQKESIQNLAAGLAASSARVLAESPDRAREAALLAIESNRLSPSFEGNQALRAAVSLLPAGVQFYQPGESNPSQRVRDMAFSPDGAMLAVARDDGSTQLLDILKHKAVGYLNPDAQPQGTIELPGDVQSVPLDNNSAVSIAFNSRGSLLATGAQDGVARIWALSDGRELLRVLHRAPVSQVAIHPAADQLVTGSGDGHVRVFDIARKAIVADLKCSDKVVAVSFSPDGNVIAALTADGVVSIFDSRARTLVRKLNGGEAAFNLAFSADSKRLAAATGDFAFVWDVSTGQQLLKSTHAAASKGLTPQQWIVDAAISSDGKFLAYAARGDNLARIWNIDTGQQILEVKHKSAVAAVAFNADGTKLGTGSYDRTARVWELPSGNELQRASHAEGAEVVGFSADGSRFAAGGMDGSVSISETRRADRPVSFNLPAPVRSVAFSPDGQRVAIGATLRASPLVRIAEISGHVLRDIQFHGAPVIDRLFFVDPNHVIAAWSSKFFQIDVDHSSMTPLRDIPGDKRIDFSGKVLAIEREGVCDLYTLPSLKKTAFLNGPPSGRLRAVGASGLLAFETREMSNTFSIDIWSVASKVRLTRIPVPTEVTRLAFDASGTILFTAEGENLQAWEIPAGKRRFSLSASDDIDLIVPDPSCSSFATVTHGILTVWDAVTGIHMAQLPDTGYLRTAAFSPDGRYLIAGYDEHSSALWLWRSGDLRDQACGRLTGNFSHEEWARWFPKRPYRQTCPNLPVVN